MIAEDAREEKFQGFNCLLFALPVGCDADVSKIGISTSESHSRMAHLSWGQLVDNSVFP
jgi:hypothetical protein